MLDTIRAANRALGRLRLGAAAVALALLAACGGGGGGGPVEVPQQCSPNNPFRGDATGPVVNASLAIEKQWVNGYVNDVYLWYDEIPNVNPNSPSYSVDTLSGFYASIDNYFNALLTPVITPSNKFKDQFSFTYPTKAWDQLINSGSTAGWGIEWHFDTLDRQTATMNGIRVAFVHPNSPAAFATLQRGDLLVSIDGLAASATNNATAYNALLDRLFPAAGQTIQFVVDRNGTQLTRTLTSTNVTLTSINYSVLTVTGGTKVGYLLFNDHVLTSEQPMIDAIAALKAQGVSDLVLDLRYNGGGYLYLASELAYMIAGPSRTTNPPLPPAKTFETSVFSNKQSARNAATPFYDVGCVPDPNFNCTIPADQKLPTLDLGRVFVLTSGSTCSASEAIINGLRGVDVDVRLIGGTTCGKPYGFFGASNCGITYFPIEFKGVNYKGYGDYADGFSPDAVGNATDLVRGCAAVDDLGHALGDPAEGQLAAALYHRQNSSCPPLASVRESPLAAGTAALRPAGVVKSTPLTNRNARMPAR